MSDSIRHGWPGRIWSRVGIKRTCRIWHRADEDLRRIAPRRQSLQSRQLQQTRSACLEHLDAAAGSEPEFRHPADPRWIPRDLGDVGPFAGTQLFNGKTW